MQHVGWLLALSIIGLLTCGGCREAAAAPLTSPNGKYQADIVSDSSGAHYRIKEISSRRVVLTTHAQFKEANNVKSGAFSADSSTFAATYHYGHEGGYSWTGVWTINTEFLVISIKNPGFHTEASRAFSAENPSAILSKNGQYKAIRIASNGSVHYKVTNMETGEQVLLTYAQYDTPNNVKAGEFNQESDKFAAAYHYSHTGTGYTWFGVWSIPEGDLAWEVKENEYIHAIPANVFIQRVPKILKFTSNILDEEMARLEWDVECGSQCYIEIDHLYYQGGVYKNLPLRGTLDVHRDRNIHDGTYRLTVRLGQAEINKEVSVPRYVSTGGSGSNRQWFYFKFTNPSSQMRPCYVEKFPATSSQEAKQLARSSATNYNVEQISEEEYYKGCRN